MADCALSVVSLAAKVAQYLIEFHDAPSAAKCVLDRADRCAQIAEQVKDVLEVHHKKYGTNFSPEIAKVKKGLESGEQECLEMLERLRKDLEPLSKGKLLSLERMFYPWKKNIAQYETDILTHMVSFNTYLAILNVYDGVHNSQPHTIKSIQNQGELQIILQTIAQVFDKDDLCDKHTVTIEEPLAALSDVAEGEARVLGDIIIPSQQAVSLETAALRGAEDAALKQMTTKLKESINQSKPEEVLRLLMTNGPCVRNCLLIDDTTTLIHHVVDTGSDEILRALLQHCAVCDPGLMDRPDDEDRTPLMVAAQQACQRKDNSIVLAETLLNHGCNVNLKRPYGDAGRNALCHAVEGRGEICQKFVDVLLDHHIDTITAEALHMTDVRNFPRLLKVIEGRRRGSMSGSHASSTVLNNLSPASSRRYTDAGIIKSGNSHVAVQYRRKHSWSGSLQRFKSK